VSYALAMVATMPASVFLNNQPWRTGISGTVWNGEVGVAGGSTVRWRFAPLRSLTSLGFAADRTATGPDTDLGGRVLVKPGHVVLDQVSGSADGTLLAAVAPGLPFSCDLTMQVKLERAVLGGSDRTIQGMIVTDPGYCRPKVGAAPAAPVPALVLTAQDVGAESRIRVAPATQRRQALVQAVLARDGRFDVSLTPEGAATLPFLGIPAGASIQTEL